MTGLELGSSCFRRVLRFDERIEDSKDHKDDLNSARTLERFKTGGSALHAGFTVDERAEASGDRRADLNCVLSEQHT